MKTDSDSTTSGERIRAVDMRSGYLVTVDGVGRRLVLGLPERYTDPDGRGFVVVQVLGGNGRPTSAVIDEDADVRKVNSDADRCALEIDPPCGEIRRIRARAGSRVVGDIEWRESDGVVTHIWPSSPLDPLYGRLLTAAVTESPQLQVPEVETYWTPDPALLVPGELIRIANGGRLLVVAQPELYTDPEGRQFYTVRTEFGPRPVTKVIDRDTEWHRERFDPSRYRFEVRSRGEGLRTARAVAGAEHGEVTWWSADGSIHQIRPTNPLHPLHRLLTDWVAERPLLTPSTDPDTLDIGDVVVGDGRQAIVTATHVRGAPERQSGFVVRAVVFIDTGEESTMTFDPTVPVPRALFDSSGISFETTEMNGNDRTITALSATGVQLGSVTWWEANGAVMHIAPTHPRNPLHRLLFDRARQLCPTLRGPMPTMPVRDNPVERIAVREAFVSGLDTGPDILGAHHLTEGTADGPWNLPSARVDALRAAWLRCRTELYVVISFNGENGAEVHTPLAWAEPGQALHIPDVEYDGMLRDHQNLVRQAAEYPVPDYLD